MFSSISEPKKKPKSGPAPSVLIPLPVPLHSDLDPNVKHFSSNLPTEYTAVIRDKKVYVPDEWQAKALFNCGCFGKGEFSRGAPTLNSFKPSKMNEEFPECSLNLKKIAQISKEKYQHRLEWSQRKENLVQSPDRDFHDLFLREFVQSNVAKPAEPTLCRVDYDQALGLGELGAGALLKTPNNPFDFMIKRMPSAQLDERLVLMYEEAFYLQFALGCLQVHDADESTCPLSLQQAWQRFVSFDERFPFKYAVYHKLRSKGWIIKNGLKYGSDFLAYYQGPERYHASFSIRVEHERLPATNRGDGGEQLTQFSALVRINETASKELMMCYVLHEGGSAQEALMSPNCLKSMSILETIVNRWTANDHNQPAPPSGTKGTSDDEF